MSVFTTVNPTQLSQWLANYNIGEVVDIKGISAGITNTNYFVTTKVAEGVAVDAAQAKLGLNRYVLTLFEHNALDELPFFVDLMAHLSQHAVPCPKPITDQSGQALHLLNEKPALMVSCLKGSDVETPTLKQCAAIGETLAQMHLASPSFLKTDRIINANPRGSQWRLSTAKKVMPLLAESEQQLLQAALDFQEKLDLEALPKGIIHADLFRDNVLFDGDTLGGFIDFYYACYDVLAYDLAIAANDWCVLPDGRFDNVRLDALLTSYEAVRPLTTSEKDHWSGLFQIAALRFWLSRLFDQHFPQTGELTYVKDPNYFKHMLQLRMQT